MMNEYAGFIGISRIQKRCYLKVVPIKCNEIISNFVKHVSHNFCRNLHKYEKWGYNNGFRIQLRDNHIKVQGGRRKSGEGERKRKRREIILFQYTIKILLQSPLSFV